MGSSVEIIERMRGYLRAVRNLADNGHMERDLDILKMDVERRWGGGRAGKVIWIRPPEGETDDEEHPLHADRGSVGSLAFQIRDFAVSLLLFICFFVILMSIFSAMVNGPNHAWAPLLRGERFTMNY